MHPTYIVSPFHCLRVTEFAYLFSDVKRGLLERAANPPGCIDRASFLNQKESWVRLVPDD